MQQGGTESATISKLPSLLFLFNFLRSLKSSTSHNCPLMHLCKAGGVGFMGMLCNVAGLLWSQVNACNNGDCGYEENKISNI